MPIVISGTNGISGVDGTASNPSYEGTDANTGVFFPAADTVAIATGGTQRLTVNSSGNTQTVGTISVGNATPSTSGAGITFPATQSASTDANTLDDYEEGTWTPTITGSTTNPTITYIDQKGTYVKVGRLVTISCAFSYSAASGGSGNLQISGLPFPSATGQTQRFSGVAGYNDIVAKNLALLIIDNSSVVLPYDATTTGTTNNISVSQLVNGTKYLQFSISYFASA